MARIVIASMPATGHVTPLRARGAALRAELARHRALALARAHIERLL